MIFSPKIGFLCEVLSTSLPLTLVHLLSASLYNDLTKILANRTVPCQNLVDFELLEMVSLLLGLSNQEMAQWSSGMIAASGYPLFR
jgi:hypothetical protein